MLLIGLSPIKSRNLEEYYVSTASSVYISYTKDCFTNMGQSFGDGAATTLVLVSICAVFYILNTIYIIFVGK